MYKYIYGSPEFSGISKEHLLKFVDLEKDVIDIAAEHNVIKDNIIATELCNFDLFSLISGEVNDIDMNINGQIYRFVNRNQMAAKPFPANESIVLYDIAKQIFDGMHALFEMKIVHCDIKPENILVTYTADKKCIFKICDFGFAAKHEDFKLEQTYSLREPDKKYGRGSRNYMILTDKYIYNTFIKDLTAYAIMLYVLVNLNMPSGIKNISDLITNGGIYGGIISSLNRAIDNFRTIYTIHETEYNRYVSIYGNITDEFIKIQSKIVAEEQDKKMRASVPKIKPIPYNHVPAIPQSISQHYSRSLTPTLSEQEWLDSLDENRAGLPY